MKLSIITINLNNAEGLRKTIESVVSQTFDDYEYIVIDGASTDDSVEVIKEYADRITYWISELDKGIFNAMNKGIKVAQGEYCLFLNSGDWLVDENVLADFLKSSPEADIISGNLMLIYENGSNELWQSDETDNLDFNCFYAGSLPHQATFIKNEVFIHFGYYNERNKIVSDREFFLKVLVFERCSYKHFDRLISYYTMNGISSQPLLMETHKYEEEVMFQKYLPPLLYRSFKNLWDENRRIRPLADEYTILRNGKLGFVVRFVLKIRKIAKKYV